MKKTQPRAYSLEFRDEAMRNWRRDARVAGCQAARTAGPSVEDENRELRREHARLKEERDILKQATAFFAKDAR